MVDLGLATCLVTGGIGTLVFLKIVCDEVIVKYRILELRVEAEAEKVAERNRAKSGQKVETVGKAEDGVVEAA